MENTVGVEEIMTSGCQSIGEHETIVDAAAKMASADIGALPVCSDDGQLIRMLTDRDIVVEVVGKGLDPAATEAGALSGNGTMVVVPIDADLDQAMKLMSVRQVRRLPVVDGNGRVVGMISQADVAAHADRSSSGAMLADISTG